MAAATLRCLSRCFSSASGTYQNLTVRDYGPVRVVAINRPHVRNAVDPETANDLFSAFNKFDQDSSVLVGILAGNGGNFCAGYDLKQLAKADNVNSLVPPYSTDRPAPLGPSRLMLSKPVIACLTGYAVAGGMELALWCDLRVAEDDVTMGFMNRRFGVPLLDGGTVRLPALIGLSRAQDLILTGRPVPAHEAHEMGLINRLVPVGKGLEKAIELANEIASFPQSCIQHDRQSALDATYQATTLSGALKNEYNTGPTVLEESVRGAKRFVKGDGKSGQYMFLRHNDTIK